MILPQILGSLPTKQNRAVPPPTQRRDCSHLIFISYLILQSVHISYRHLVPARLPCRLTSTSSTVMRRPLLRSLPIASRRKSRETRVRVAGARSSDEYARVGVTSARWDLASDEFGRRDQRCRRSVLRNHVTSQRLRGILSRAAHAIPLTVCVQRRRDCCAAWLQRVRPGLPTVDDGSSGTGAGPAAARPMHDQAAGDCCTNEQQ